MKNTLLAVIVALVLSGGAFAQTDSQNYHYGLDISVATGFGNMKYTEVTPAFNSEYSSGIFVPEFRIGTFDSFLLNNIFGFYASVAAGNAFQINKTLNGSDKDMNKIEGGVAFDLAFGPSFGFDINSSRFQTGIGFHFNLSAVEMRELNGTATTKTSDFLFWLGMSLSPQFRFTANRRCSFIIGCDLFIDFGTTGSKRVAVKDENNKVTDVYTGDTKIESAFRFAATPYIGIGINFGAH